MSRTLDETARELRERRLVDRGLLRPRGRQEVLAAIERWRERGMRAWVLVLERDEPLAPWHALSETMQLGRPDLLLLFNGRRWEARGWGLPADRVERALEAARPSLGTYWGRGLVEALDRLGAAATGRPAPRPESRPRSSSPIGWGAGAALLAGGGVLAWLIGRRMRLAKERRGKIDQARSSAERTYADLVLAAEDLSSEDAMQLQMRAARLKEQLDQVVEQARSSGDDEVTIGRVRQVENELSALQSTVLQKRRGS